MIPVQAAVMNLLSIGGAIGATVAVFQWGWLGGLLGVQKGPVEAWIPLLAFAVLLDAIVVRCVLLPAVLELLDTITWRLPHRLGARLPQINIEGSAARALSRPEGAR